MPLILIDPCDNPDLRLEFRHEWLPYVLGALKQLMLQSTWKTTNSHDLYVQQGYVANLLSCFAMATANLPCPEPILESDYEMSLCEQLRIQDGKLQALCCGEWTDIPGQAGFTLGGPDQQGDGAPQPAPGGGCQTYHAQFDAKSQYLVPTVVSAGDVLTFTNAKGSGHDGTVSPWRCPNGLTFFAGACIGLGGTSGTDPAPSINHMALIAKIGSVYYPAYGGSITVPGGIANEQVIIFANDSNLLDNSGSYSVDVEVCNNATARFTHHFDFRLSPGPFIAQQLGGTNNTTWVPGTGFTCSTTTGLVSNGDNIIDADNAAPLAHCVLRLVGSNTSGVDTSNADKGYSTNTVTGSPTEDDVFSAHGAIDHSHTCVATPIKSMRMVIGSGATVGDSSIITDLYVTADGLDPF